MSVPLWLWFAVLAVILVMLAIDLLAHRGERVVSSAKPPSGPPSG